MDKAKKSEIKAKVLAELLSAVGKNNALSMQELHRRVFGKEPQHDVHDTRFIRRIITELRKSGVPIASSTAKNSGGYYTPVGSELSEYCRQLRNRALQILAIEAKIKKRRLSEIVHEIALSLGG